MSKKQNFRIEGRIWIDSSSDNMLGDGKVELLRQIGRLGSLRQAAESMNMSYKKAWLSIKKMNEIAPETMVLLCRGGKEGGSATLTTYAEDILNRYEELQKNFHTFLKEQNDKWNG